MGKRQKEHQEVQNSEQTSVDKCYDNHNIEAKYTLFWSYISGESFLCVWACMFFSFLKSPFPACSTNDREN